MYQDTQQVDVRLDFENSETKTDIKPKSKKLWQRLLQPKYLMLQARHWRRSFLSFLHSKTLDRRFDKLLFVKAKGEVREIELQFSPSKADETTSYETVPIKTVKWAMDILAGEEKGAVFVDCKAGRGERMLVAAARPYDQIIGIETQEFLREDAVLNIAQFPRSYMRCRNIECINVDAQSLPVPDGRAVYLFHKPRDMGDLQAQINRVAGEYKKNPRRFYVLTIGAAPQVEDIILESGIFETAKYSAVAGLKHALLSPYKIKAYKTLV